MVTLKWFNQYMSQRITFGNFDPRGGGRGRGHKLRLETLKFFWQVICQKKISLAIIGMDGDGTQAKPPTMVAVPFTTNLGGKSKKSFKVG